MIFKKILFILFLIVLNTCNCDEIPFKKLVQLNDPIIQNEETLLKLEKKLNQIEQLISDNKKAFYEFLQWKNQLTVFKELPEISGN